MSKIRIALDAGHGSNTCGKRSVKLTKDIGKFKKGTQIHEHWINAYICVRLAKLLKAMGYEVVKSAWDDNIVTDDSDVGLTVRQTIIKKAKCDYSISVHQNACGDGVKWNTGNGTEVLYHENSAKVGDSKEMANYILKELIKGTDQSNRGAKPDELAMCNCRALGVKASVLVECAFMTNKKETEEMLVDEDYWDECAKEIANGMDKYIKAHKK